MGDDTHDSLGSAIALPSKLPRTAFISAERPVDAILTLMEAMLLQPPNEFVFVRTAGQRIPISIESKPMLSAITPSPVRVFTSRN